MLMVTFSSNIFLPNVMIKDTCILLNTQFQLSYAYLNIVLEDKVYKITFSSGYSTQTNNISKYLEKEVESDINKYVRLKNNDVKKYVETCNGDLYLDYDINNFHKPSSSLPVNSILIEKIKDLVEEDNKIENIFNRLSFLNKK